MSVFISPPGINSLTEQGNDSSRIGDGIVRNAKMEQIFKIEKTIKQFSPLPVSVDAVSPEPPYFNYFSYCDVLGGVLLQAGSVEISARVTKVNLEDQTTIINKFNLDWAFDKYCLSDSIMPYPMPNVILLPGSNLLPLIDQSKLLPLIRNDWVIKPHPITTEPTLREIGRNYGYQKLLGPKISGHQLFKQATAIATTQASEFYVLAALSGKQLVDLTKYEYSWTAAYQCFAQCVSDDVDETKVRMEKAIMHPSSGWIHPSMSDEEIDIRVNNYFALAMQLREPFKMVSTQALIGRTNHIKQWDLQDPSKQGPRQALE